MKTPRDHLHNYGLALALGLLLCLPACTCMRGGQETSNSADGTGASLSAPETLKSADGTGDPVAKMQNKGCSR